MTTIHGIKNCDTMKRASAWLVAHGVIYRFHDYRIDGLDPAMLEGWVARLGWDALLNRAGTTFRKLPEADKNALTETRALYLMLRQPAMIRRPVLVHDHTLTIGFKLEHYAALFGR